MHFQPEVSVAIKAKAGEAAWLRLHELGQRGIRKELAPGPPTCPTHLPALLWSRPLTCRLRDFRGHQAALCFLFHHGLFPAQRSE